MLHRQPAREGQPSWPWWLYLLLLLWAAFLALWFSLGTPSWDVLFFHVAALLVLLLAAPFALFFWRGARAVQVEHVGVVVSWWLFRRCWRRRVYPAQRVLAFDWEEEGGAFVCRLFARPSDFARRGARVTLMTTDSPYRAAALLRDLELHYPGCGLRAEQPARLRPRRRASRWLGAVVAALAVAYMAVLGPYVALPLRVAAAGERRPAVIHRVLWDSPKRNSTYHLEVIPQGDEEVLSSATSFPPAAYMPAPGMVIPVFCAPGLPFYDDRELMAYLMPLPLGALGLLMLATGLGVACQRASRPEEAEEDEEA